MPRKRAQPGSSEASAEASSSPAVAQPPKKKRKSKAPAASSAESESSFNTNDISSSSSQAEQHAEVEVVPRQVPSYRDIQTTATADGESPRVTSSSAATSATVPALDALGISGNAAPQAANTSDPSFASSSSSSGAHAQPLPQSSSAESLAAALGPLFGHLPSVVGNPTLQQGYPPQQQWPSDNAGSQYAAPGNAPVNTQLPNQAEYASRRAPAYLPIPCYVPIQYIHPRPGRYWQSTDPANYHFICPAAPQGLPARGDCPVLTCPINCNLHGMPTTFGPPIYSAQDMNLAQQLLGGQPDEPVFGPPNFGIGQWQVSDAYSGLINNNVGSMGFAHIPADIDNFNPNAYVPIVPDWARAMQAQHGVANMHRVAQQNSAWQAERMRQEQAAYGDYRPFCSYCLNNIAFCGGVLDCCSHLLYEHEFASVWM